MRLDFFMLADGASTAEGKIYIHGGAITRLMPPSLPSPPLVVTVVARLLVDEEDRGRPPVPVAIEWLRPDDTQMVPPLRALVSSEVPPGGVRDREDQGTVIVAHTLVSFDRQGSHQVRFYLGNNVIASRRLFVTEPEPQGPAAGAAGDPAAAALPPAPDEPSRRAIPPGDA